MVKQLKPILRLLWSGLFLDVRSYDEAADSDNPFVEGLFMVAVIGLLVALAQIVGKVLGWAVMPDLEQIKTLVHDGLVSMSWFQQFVASSAQSLQQFENSYDIAWQIVHLFAPNPRLALLALFLIPLQLLVQWLWFALIAQAVAQMLGGQGKMKQTLGASALAFTPHLLYVFRALPMVGVAAVGAWTLLAQYVALRRVHENLSWPRVLTAVVAPSLLLWLLIIVLIVVIAPLLGALMGGMVS